ncbi:MAG: metallophosphoesterase [Pseudomonadales bacterium]|nr:metallophosphoesterase [Pseudomonadales bacterium]
MPPSYQEAAKQRLFVISDIHIDYKENREILLALSDTDYIRDTLLIAGDATDSADILRSFLAAMANKFAKVLFVPGNHELWLKRSDHTHSLDKFHELIEMCVDLGVDTTPQSIGSQQRLWLVPLFSWYHTAEHGERSLFLEKKGVEDKTHEMWGDFFATKWPSTIEDDICGHFLEMNQSALGRDYDAPVVSFSHFLPRQELMLSTEAERAASRLNFKDLHPEFNFSRVAGSTEIESQLRSLGSRVHVYGHQHRNRQRQIEGVTYLSHCMGYPKERKVGVVDEACAHPLEIWNDQDGFLV